VRRLTAASETERRLVRASLVQIGRRALPAIIDRLLHTSADDEQHKLIDVLSRIARRLSPGERNTVIQVTIGLRSTSESIRRGLARGIAALRLLNEQATGAGSAH
jgi:hypothetical protein